MTDQSLPYLWRVVRVPQLGGHVQLEAWGPLCDAIPQLHTQHSSLCVFGCVCVCVCVCVIMLMMPSTHQKCTNLKPTTLQQSMHSSHYLLEGHLHHITSHYLFEGHLQQHWLQASIQALPNAL